MLPWLDEYRHDDDPDGYHHGDDLNGCLICAQIYVDALDPSQLHRLQYRNMYMDSVSQELCPSSVEHLLLCYPPAQHLFFRECLDMVIVVAASRAKPHADDVQSALMHEDFELDDARADVRAHACVSGRGGGREGDHVGDHVYPRVHCSNICPDVLVRIVRERKTNIAR